MLLKADSWLVQHLLYVVDSPMFDDRDPIHVIEEYTGWCRRIGPVGLDIALWKWEPAARCCIVMREVGIAPYSSLGTSAGFRAKLGV